MDKKCIVFLLVIAIVKSDDFDCEQAPPSNVDPFTCCAISKPFNQFNFPECFPDVTPTTTARSIRTTDRNYLRNDRYYPQGDSSLSYGNIPNSNRRSGYNSNNNNYNNGYGPRYQDRQDDNYYDYNRDRPQNRDYGSRRQYDSHYHHGPPFWAHHHHEWNDGNRDNRQYRSDRRYRNRRQIKWTTARRVKQLRQLKLDSGNCAIQCIFNQTKVIKNERLDRDAALVMYAKYYPEIPLNLLTRAVNKCAKHVIALQNRAIVSVNRNRITSTQKQCRDGSGVFAACFNREVLTNCPDELRSDSDDCNVLRDYIDNCSPVGGVRELAEFAFNASIILPDY